MTFLSNFLVLFQFTKRIGPSAIYCKKLNRQYIILNILCYIIYYIILLYKTLKEVYSQLRTKKIKVSAKTLNPTSSLPSLAVSGHFSIERLLPNKMSFFLTCSLIIYIYSKSKHLRKYFTITCSTVMDLKYNIF